jgi:hypothetical protein
MDNFRMSSRVNNLRSHTASAVPRNHKFEKIPVRRRVITTFPATPPTNPISLTPSTWTTFSSLGSRIFSEAFNYNGTGTVTNTLTTDSLWKNTNQTLVSGPFNRSAIWSSTNPTNIWLGFSTCLNIPTGQSKTYYIGIAGDNHYRLVLDGTTLLETTSLGNTGETFLWWNIYPIVLTEGDHVLEIYGLNISGPGGFGAEIYDNTLQELINSTQLSDIDIIWTTRNYTAATIIQDLNGAYLSTGYTCPENAVYSECTGNCVRMEYVYE